MGNAAVAAAVFMIVVIAFLALLFIPIESSSASGTRVTVCDVKILMSGTWSEGFLILDSTVKNFNTQTSLSNCRDASAFDTLFSRIQSSFAVLAQNNIFPTQFWLRANVVDSNGIIHYSRGSS